MTAIVDCNSVCHRVWYTLGDLSFEEKKVGVLFGFLRQLLTIAKRLKTNKFIFCWDSKSRKRIEICPTYKSNRVKARTEEEEEDITAAYAQFTLLRKEILPKIGFKNNFYAEGYESDDIIAKIVKEYNHNFVIVSTDGDLYQLLNDNVSMLTDNKKPFYTKESFKAQYDILPCQWPLVKSIAGCKSDNVIGVRGVGDKTAIKYLNNELPKTSKAYKVIESNYELLNLQLVHLPFVGIGRFPLVKDKLSFDGLLEVCNQYGFYSLTTKESIKVWKEIFFL